MLGGRNGFRETAGKSRVQSPDGRDHAHSRTRRRTEAVTHRRERLGPDPIRGSGGKGESSEGGGECACGRADSEAAATAAATPGGQSQKLLAKPICSARYTFWFCSWIAAPRPRLCPPFLVSADPRSKCEHHGTRFASRIFSVLGRLVVSGSHSCSWHMHRGTCIGRYARIDLGSPRRATRSICKTNPCPMSRI